MRKLLVIFFLISFKFSFSQVEYKITLVNDSVTDEKGYLKMEITLSNLSSDSSFYFFFPSSGGEYHSDSNTFVLESDYSRIKGLSPGEKNNLVRNLSFEMSYNLFKSTFDSAKISPGKTLKIIHKEIFWFIKQGRNYKYTVQLIIGKTPMCISELDQLGYAGLSYVDLLNLKDTECLKILTKRMTIKFKRNNLLVKDL